MSSSSGRSVNASERERDSVNSRRSDPEAPSRRRGQSSGQLDAEIVGGTSTTSYVTTGEILGEREQVRGGPVPHHRLQGDIHHAVGGTGELRVSQRELRRGGPSVSDRGTCFGR